MGDEARMKEEVKKLGLALKELDASVSALKESYLDTIHRLTVVAEYKDEDTPAHIRRVGHYARHIANLLGWPEEEQAALFYAAPMHDIGKVGVPAEILLKPGRLTTEEFALMKSHTAIGGRILHGSPSMIIQMAGRIAFGHHERWDGSGYPRGLDGAEIPEEVSIMSLADQYDSLRSTRPFRSPLDHETALRIIAKGDGRTMPQHFDPRILKIFKDTHVRFKEIFESMRG